MYLRMNVRTCVCMHVWVVQLGACTYILDSRAENYVAMFFGEDSPQRCSRHLAVRSHPCLCGRHMTGWRCVSLNIRTSNQRMSVIILKINYMAVECVRSVCDEATCGLCLFRGLRVVDSIGHRHAESCALEVQANLGTGTQ